MAQEILSPEINDREHEWYEHTHGHPQDLEVKIITFEVFSSQTTACEAIYAGKLRGWI